MLRGYSASLINPSSHVERRLTRSWAELNAFFEAEKESSEGRSYKNSISGQMQEYRGWVFSAIDCITDRICSLNYQFYMKDSGEQFLSTSPAYTAITKPIVNPNKNMTFRFIKQWCQIQLDLCGKAAILKLRNQLGMPWELWPLDMNYFDGLVFPKNATFITPPTGYAFKFGNNRKVLPARDIIWLRYPHPTDLWGGFSPIQAQAYATDVDHYIEVYERNFFKNSARVDFIIQAKDANIDEDTAKRIKEQWVTKYGGIKRSYEPAVLSGGLEIVPITMTAKDFQFMELAGWSKDKVLSAYRVPEGKLGLFRDINRANQKGIDIAFNEECYSEDTEFLTNDGWKIINEYNNEKIATVNPNTYEVEYYLPNSVYYKPYIGKMVHFNTRQIDMLVTPGHNIWASRQTGNSYKKPRLINGEYLKWVTKFAPWEFNLAKELGYNDNGIGKTRTYLMNPPVMVSNEIDIKKVRIPEIPRNGWRYKNCRYETSNKEYVIDGDIWFEFLGYFISEGGLRKSNYQISLTQKANNSDRIISCIEKLPFTISHGLSKNYYGKKCISKFFIGNKSLWTYLTNECGEICNNKRIPKLIMNGSKRQKEIFFDGLMFGDGAKSKCKNKRKQSAEYVNFSSSSEQLINQLSILALELGYKVSFGKPWKTKNDTIIYRLNFTKMPYSSIRAYQIKNVDYNGFVWCFNVPNHLFITKRNGKIAIQGNSIVPRITLWDDEISKQLIEEFTDKVVMKHDNPVPRDREIDLQELKLRTGGVAINTINEARNWWDGAKAIEGGDDVLIDQRYIPLADSGKQQEAERQDGNSQGDKKPDASNKPGKDDNTPEYDQEHDPGGEESEKVASRNYLLTLQVYKKVLAHTKGWSYEKSREKALEYCEKFNVPVNIIKTFVYCVSRDLPIERFKQEILEELINKAANKVRR